MEGSILAVPAKQEIDGRTRNPQIGDPALLDPRRKCRLGEKDAPFWNVEGDSEHRAKRAEHGRRRPCLRGASDRVRSGSTARPSVKAAEQFGQAAEVAEHRSLEERSHNLNERLLQAVAPHA